MMTNTNQVACPSTIKRLLIQTLGDDFEGFRIQIPGHGKVRVKHADAAKLEAADKVLSQKFETRYSNGSLIIGTRESKSVLRDHLVRSHVQRVNILHLILAERGANIRNRRRYRKQAYRRSDFETQSIRKRATASIVGIRRIREAIVEFNTLCPNEPIEFKKKEKS